MRRVWTGVRRLAAWLADHEIWWFAPTLPLLIFPGRWNVVGLVLLAVPWLCRLVGRGRLTVPTRLEWTMFSLLLMVPVTLWATALPDVTLPAIYQLLAGVAVFYSIVNWASWERLVRWARHHPSLLGKEQEQDAVDDVQDLAIVVAAKTLILLQAADQVAVEETVAQRLDGLADLSPQAFAHLDPRGGGVLVELF